MHTVCMGINYILWNLGAVSHRSIPRPFKPFASAQATPLAILRLFAGPWTGAPASGTPPRLAGRCPARVLCCAVLCPIHALCTPYVWAG